VVLCLRGADKTLPALFHALAGQDYPGPWRLLVVVDSKGDPAWAVAQEQKSAHEKTGGASWHTARIVELNRKTKDNTPHTGSLKCMALKQSFTSLHNDSDVIALIDADAVVASGWLTALAAGCQQPGIGAVSGNRWYAPRPNCLGAEVRAIWNMGALVMMTILGIPWGGSLAVRRCVIDDSSWTNQLETSFGEDTSLPSALKTSGWRHEFRPELLVVDRDSPYELKTIEHWITR